MREACSSFAEKLTGLFSEIVFKTMTVQLLRDLEEMEISLSQLQALNWIAERRCSTVGDIAGGLSVTHPAAVKLINRLEEKRWVDRTVSPSDHRQSMISATPAGRELVNAVRSERMQRLQQVLDRMAPADREALIRGLESFVTAALQSEGALDGICWSCQTLLPTDCQDFARLHEGNVTLLPVEM